MHSSNTGGLTDEPFPTLGGNAQVPSRFGPNAGSSTSSYVAQPTGPGLHQLLGDRILADADRSIDVADIKADIIGIYFSAHWCPPCRNFTPRLATLYRAALQRNKSFEIVFASRDRSQTEFAEYFAQMPWKALFFSEQMRIQTLMTIWKIRGIPSMVLVDKMGNVLQMNDVVRSIGQFPENFLLRLPDRRISQVMEQPIPPQDPAVANMTIDDLFKELQDDVSLTQEQRFQGLSTLRTLLGNIKKDPSNPKFRKINKDNKSISEKVLKYAVFTKLLKVSGFRETATTLVAPLSVPLPEACEQVLLMVDALVESLESASPSGPSPSAESQPVKSPEAQNDYECKDGVCRRREDDPKPN